jgi:ELWxxDGT repeat protein
MTLRLLYPTWAPDPLVGLSNWELGLSDGTIAGTGVLKDIYTGTSPGPGGMGTVPNSSHPVYFTQIGYKMIFEATDGNGAGRELWVTDGTFSGTVLLKDINTTSPTANHDAFDRNNSWDFSSDQSVRFGHPTYFNGYVYFSANGTDNNTELWRTDGTTAGTTLFKEINPGANGSFPMDFFVNGDKLYFDANDGVHGSELWVTDGIDGTAAHTFMVKDIGTGNDPNNAGSPLSGFPFNFASLGNYILFQALTNETGDELWISDGTPGGTQLLKDIAPWKYGPTFQFAANSNPAYLTYLNGRIFFEADNVTTDPANNDPNNPHPFDDGQELWVTDGTAAGTFMFANINTLGNGNVNQNQGSAPYDLTYFHNKIYFFANDGSHGYELWVTDGVDSTAPHTHLFADINTTGVNQGSNGNNLTVSGNLLYFTASDGINGEELWVTDGIDGTAAHTHIVKDIRGPGLTSSAPRELLDVNGTLYFTSYDNTNNTGTNNGLFKTDGTANGTVELNNNYAYGQGYNGFNFIKTHDWSHEFSGDQKTDLLLHNASTNGVAVWLMNGVTVSSSPQVGTAAAGWNITHTGDFDGDHKADLLLQNPNTLQASVWLMNGSAVKASPLIGTEAPGWGVTHVGDFNGDGTDDIFLQNPSAHSIAVWLINGGQVVANPLIGTVGSGWNVTDYGDFNGDGKTDLLLQNPTTLQASIWLMDGATVKASPIIGTEAPGWGVTHVGDFNGDGTDDIFLQNPSTHSLSVWLMKGTQVVASPVIGTTAAGWNVTHFGDFNADGKTDLLLENPSTFQASVWLMDGTNVTASPVIGTEAAGWGVTDLVDFNGDDKTDILLQNTNHDLAVWLMNGGTVTSNPIIGHMATGWDAIY